MLKKKKLKKFIYYVLHDLLELEESLKCGISMKLNIQIYAPV